MFESRPKKTTFTFLLEVSMDERIFVPDLVIEGESPSSVCLVKSGCTRIVVAIYNMGRVCSNGTKRHLIESNLDRQDIMSRIF